MNTLTTKIATPIALATVHTTMHEVLETHLHLVRPFETVTEIPKVKISEIYLKNIMHECLNQRTTIYKANLKAVVTLKNGAILELSRWSNKSKPLACGLY